MPSSVPAVCIVPVARVRMAQSSSDIRTTLTIHTTLTIAELGSTANDGGQRLKLLGRFFIVAGASVVEHHVDLEKLTRGLIQPWEKVED